MEDLVRMLVGPLVSQAVGQPPQVRHGRTLSRGDTYKNPCINYHQGMKYVIFHYEDNGLEMMAVNEVDPTEGFRATWQQSALSLKDIVKALEKPDAVALSKSEEDCHFSVVTPTPGDVKDDTEGKRVLPATRLDAIQALAACQLHDARRLYDIRGEQMQAKFEKTIMGALGGSSSGSSSSPPRPRVILGRHRRSRSRSPVAQSHACFAQGAPCKRHRRNE
jgi:hypothetical protein